MRVLGRTSYEVTDAAGRIIATVDALGYRTATTWDDRDRQLSSVDALGGVIGAAYDANGNLLTLTDAKGHATNYAYNTANQLLSTTDALTHGALQAYRVDGALQQRIDRRGQLSSASYDALGRVTQVGLGATVANPTAFTSVLVNSWDAGDGLMQSVRNTCASPVTQPNCASATVARAITHTYDDLDRLISEVSLHGEVDYSYDNGGRRTSMTIKNGLAGAQINGGTAQDIVFTYDVAGQRTRTRLANGSTVDYTYDDAGEVLTIVYRTADGTLIGDLQYEYDANGRRTGMAGNLAQVELPAADVTDATYNANDALLTWAGATYSYDGEGNLVADGAQSYAWDVSNRLAAIRKGSIDLALYQYDAFGRRSGKTIGDDATGFLYDGSQIVQELAGLTNTANVKAHLLAGDLDEVLLRLEGNDGTSRQSILIDSGRNTVMTTSASQVTSASFAYTPYGATTASTATSHAYQYTGRENDGVAGLGLYYYRARYYSPTAGRFLSQDPIGFDSGQTNRYSYVGGDPINSRDPSGLEPEDSGGSDPCAMGGPDLGGSCKKDNKKKPYGCITVCHLVCRETTKDKFETQTEPTAEISEIDCSNSTKKAKGSSNMEKEKKKRNMANCRVRHCSCEDTEGFRGTGTACENHHR